MRAVTLAILLAASALGAGCAALRHEQAAAGSALPAGWSVATETAFSKPWSGELVSDFDGDSRPDRAVMLAHGDKRAIAVFLGSVPAAAPKLITEWTETPANPTSLVLVQRGVYRPRCAAPPNCPTLALANDAIGLDYEHSSGEVLYFKDGGFRQFRVGQ